MTRSARLRSRLVRQAPLALIVVGLASAIFAVFAADGPPGGGPGNGRPPGSPPEALAACAGKTAGAGASYTDRRGTTITGTCETMGDVLAVRPAGMPPPRWGSASGAAR